MKPGSLHSTNFQLVTLTEFPPRMKLFVSEWLGGEKRISQNCGRDSARVKHEQ